MYVLWGGGGCAGGAPGQRGSRHHGEPQAQGAQAVPCTRHRRRPGRSLRRRAPCGRVAPAGTRGQSAGAPLWRPRPACTQAGAAAAAQRPRGRRCRLHCCCYLYCCCRRCCCCFCCLTRAPDPPVASASARPAKRGQPNIMHATRVPCSQHAPHAAPTRAAHESCHLINQYAHVMRLPARRAPAGRTSRRAQPCQRPQQSSVRLAMSGGVDAAVRAGLLSGMKWTLNNN